MARCFQDTQFLSIFYGGWRFLQNLQFSVKSTGYFTRSRPSRIFLKAHDELILNLQQRFLGEDWAIWSNDWNPDSNQYFSGKSSTCLEQFSHTPKNNVIAYIVDNFAKCLQTIWIEMTNVVRTEVSMLSLMTSLFRNWNQCHQSIFCWGYTLSGNAVHSLYSGTWLPQYKFFLIKWNSNTEILGKAS